MIRGSCLCNGVQFTINGKTSEVGHCHCSKCRKVSGVNSNGVIIVAAKNVVWLEGTKLFSEYKMPDGWVSTFCRKCGSPLPMSGAGGKLYWVPVGLLDDDPGVPVAQHIYVGSKASWEVIGDDAPQYTHEAPNSIDA